MKLHSLYEDNHLLIVNKPAGLATMGVASHEQSLWTVAKEYLKQKYQKPGNVYLGVVSRLDSPVSGAVVFARTSKAAARLNAQFRERCVEKTYWAIVEGEMRAKRGTLENWLQHDEPNRRMMVSVAAGPPAKLATLEYRVLRRVPHGTLIEVRLHTGRKHQIRVQMAHLGHPIVGDVRYGARRQNLNGIALHARHLQLQHPVRNTPVAVQAPLPLSWKKLLSPGDD